jgi:hypothetical protein
MGEHNLVIRQGETFKLDVIYKNSGSAVDITDWKARMQIRATHTSLVLIADLDNGDIGGITLDGDAGKVSILIPADKTAAFSVVDGVYDIELEDPDGVVVRVLQGTTKLDLEVTR